MSSTPTQTHPEFVFLFLAVRRADVHAVPHRETVIAPNERSARRLLARDYVLAFAGRLPVEGRVMFDNTPLDLEEIIDQCRALAYALVELEQPQAKEILTFVLWERLDNLHRAFHQPVAGATMTNSLFPCGYTQNGEERIHRALEAAECMADLLRHHADHPNKPLNSDGLAAIFECVRDQLNSAVESSAFFAGGNAMSAINTPTSPAFKMALLRHYIASAFIEAMTAQHGQAVYVLNGSRIPLTADKVAINIIRHLEAPYIDQFGCAMGQPMAAQVLYEMLEPGFMHEAVRLSAYGYRCLSAVYVEIANGATDGELPPGAVVETLTAGGKTQ